MNAALSEQSVALGRPEYARVAAVRARFPTLDGSGAVVTRCVRRTEHADASSA